MTTYRFRPGPPAPPCATCRKIREALSKAAALLNPARPSQKQGGKRSP
jgi:hypothetical protein